MEAEDFERAGALSAESDRAQEQLAELQRRLEAADGSVADAVS